MEDLMISLALVAFTMLINIPLGMWRASVRKFSAVWMVAVHASVPIIIALRLWLKVSYWLVPVLIATAILAQWIGSRLYMNRSGLDHVGEVGED